MEEESKLFIASIIFRKSIVPVNGDQQLARQTIRIIKAKDREAAKAKLQIFWKEKMKSFQMIQAEITSPIE